MGVGPAGNDPAQVADPGRLRNGLPVLPSSVEAAAEQAKGATKFSDVPATHWASGYINIVVDQGFMHG